MVNRLEIAKRGVGRARGEEWRGRQKRGPGERGAKGWMAEMARLYNKEGTPMSWKGEVEGWKELRASATAGGQHGLCMQIQTRVRPDNLHPLLCCVIFNHLVQYQPYCWM